jgi:antitoxin VapB
MPSPRQKGPLAKAKLFTTGRSQAVRLPKDFRFRGKEVYIRRDVYTGDVVLSQEPSKSWDEIFRKLDEEPFPSDFMADRDQGESGMREPL